MKLSVRLFASVREALGSNSLVVDLPDGATVRSLLGELKARFPQMRDSSAEKRGVRPKSV